MLDEEFLSCIRPELSKLYLIDSVDVVDLNLCVKGRSSMFCIVIAFAVSI